MSKGLKIFVGVVVFLGILSGIFLLTAKKKPAVTAPVSQTKKTAPAVQNKTTTPAPAEKRVEKVPSSQSGNVDKKAATNDEWKACKERTLASSKTLLWSVQISEGIPAGGTYAKGTLNNDSTLPVRVILKSDSQILEKIKAMLAPGKTAALRGNCTDIAPDGSVIFQAF